MLGFGAPGAFGVPGALGGFGAPGAEGGAGDALALLPVSTFAPQKGHSSGKTPKTAFTRFPQFGQSADWSSPAGLKHIDIAPFSICRLPRCEGTVSYCFVVCLDSNPF